jgi:hypothetical protein
MRRRHFVLAGAGIVCLPASAHHGWSSFDQSRPIYLEGKVVKSHWRNPHVELDLQVKQDLKLPADLAQRSLPAQSASVDGPALLAAAKVPTRNERVWHIELAPLTRMNAWKVDEIKAGDDIALVGFTFPQEQGEPVLRAEYLFVAGKTYGLRSSPA